MNCTSWWHSCHVMLLYIFSMNS